MDGLGAGCAYLDDLRDCEDGHKREGEGGDGLMQQEVQHVDARERVHPHPVCGFCW